MYDEKPNCNWLLVGLGNPGKRYENTPHNVGFQVLDKLSKRLEFRLKRAWRFRAKIGIGYLKDMRLVLVKPMSFMNFSGEVVVSIMRYFRIPAENVIVVMDDADLSLGVVRVKARGGSGGHRGLDSIIRKLGGQKFIRVRLGIGRDTGGLNLVEHVLTPLDEKFEKVFMLGVNNATNAVLSCVQEGVDQAMNRFNNRRDLVNS